MVSQGQQILFLVHFVHYKFMRKGFTLVELLVVIAIIGILLALIGSNFQDARVQTRDAKRKSDLESIRSALELFKSDNGYYPNNSAYSSLTPNYINKLPNDPSGGSYTYRADPATCDGGGKCYKYILGAFLENNPPNNCTVTLSCSPLGSCNYCVTNP